MKWIMGLMCLALGCNYTYAGMRQEDGRAVFLGYCVYCKQPVETKSRWVAKEWK